MSQVLVPPRWVVSDTHFGHRNIARYAGRPDDHEQRMIAAWAERVGPRDTLLHLGDLCLSSREQMERIAARLPGRKLLVKGNHDRRGRGWYSSLGFTVVEPFSLELDGWTIHFSHVPDSSLLTGPRQLNLHGHIHQHVLEDRRLVNLSVEQTGYAPVDLRAAVRERIAELDQAAPGT